jgi:sterol desaturase/sphingolipid hydroxylase (fatty acid hydroxylase superfamily)
MMQTVKFNTVRYGSPSEGEADDRIANRRFGRGGLGKARGQERWVGTLKPVTSLFALTGLFISHHADGVFSVAGLFTYSFRAAPAVARERQLNSTNRAAPRSRGKSQWSILGATLIFAVPGAFMLEGWLWRTRGSTEPARYGWSYFVLSLRCHAWPLHETCFLLTHRLLHISRGGIAMRTCVHHESLSPSPWASFSFHPPVLSD